MPSGEQGLGKEVVVVVAIQMVLVLALVQLSRLLSMGGALHAMVGAVFIVLPVLVLDRRGKPYGRYGLKFSNPLPEIPWLLGAALLTYIPIVVAIFLFPEIWGGQNRLWQPQMPDNYLMVALSQFIIVALPEEYFYRGYLLGRLDDIFKRRVRILGIDVGPGLVIQAALFALGHYVVDFNPSRLMVFFPALAFGWLRLRRGTITLSVMYHGCCNIFMELFRAGYGF